MAIAYFIPDQRKLLARSSTQPQQQHHNAHSTNSSSTTTPASQQHQQQTTTSANSTATTTNNSNFRANISIPLPPCDATTQSVGCWELITQIFCYALRFYRQSANLRPSVIEISFQFSDGGRNESSTTTPTSATATPTDATLSSAQQPPTTSDPAARREN